METQENRTLTGGAGNAGRRHALLELIREDMKPALGVTEPAAIALAAAHARALTEEEIVELRVRMNSGIYKNACTCGIPGTEEVGNDFSAALGAIAGRKELGLLVLQDVDDAAVEKAREMIRAGKVRTEMDGVSSSIRIRAVVRTLHDTCTAEIRGTHTGLCLLEKNGEVLFRKEEDDSKKEQDVSSQDAPAVTDFSFSEIFRLVNEAPIEELRFITAAFEMNLALAEAGAKWPRCRLTAKMLSSGGFYTEDARRSAKTLALAAAEARVLGIALPAMSITGSGTHGIICTLPLYAYAKVKQLPEELLLRATALSYLVCMLIKEHSGKLSAFCGCGIAGGTGLAAALSLMMGGDEEAAEAAARNMVSSLTGMICTGGNHCCCLKVMSAADSAFNAAELAASGVSVAAPHGILDESIDTTLRNVGLIADPGMTETERTIVGIMSR